MKIIPLNKQIIIEAGDLLVELQETEQEKQEREDKYKREHPEVVEKPVQTKQETAKQEIKVENYKPPTVYGPKEQ